MPSIFTAPRLASAPASETLARPRIPDRIEDLGIRHSIVSDLFLRYLWLRGSGTLTGLHATLKLSYPLLETVFQQLRVQQLLEVKGMVGNDYSFTLTARGRGVATARYDVCQYVGPAPVSLTQYHAIVTAQAAKLQLRRETLRQAFDDLVLPDSLLDQLGPSIIEHQSLFLYGGTGNGKTSIAERIIRLYKDPVVVPYAVEVDGQIVTLYDPAVHRALPSSDEALDPRWVLCERPCVTVGGELSASMLELRLDESSYVFIAPCQWKANNGILIIDDFGRQMLSPRDLLNRWIVPLDRRVDYLTLTSGMKFQVPFELLVVFSTNLDPRDLADEAFLRRIQTKVLVADVSFQVFDQIFQRVAETHNVPADADAAEYLRQRCLERDGSHLRASYPIDIFRLIKAIGEYEGSPVRFTKAAIDQAVALYFAKNPGL